MAKAAIRKAIGVKVAIGDAALKRKVQVFSPSRVAVTFVGSSVSLPCMTILSRRRIVSHAFSSSFASHVGHEING